MIYLSNLLQFYLSFYPWGIDNPSLTLGCKYLFFVCRYHSRSIVWCSYWFDNLGLITEGNTYRRCAASSLPLWDTNVVQATSKGISGAIIGETSSTSTRFLITYLISSQLHYLPFSSCFPLPHFTKICYFIRPSFSFVVFLPDLFLSAILFCSHIFLSTFLNSKKNIGVKGTS